MEKLLEMKFRKDTVCIPLIALLLLLPPAMLRAHKRISLGNGRVQLTWQPANSGYRLSNVTVDGVKCNVAVGSHSVVYSQSKPSVESVSPDVYGADGTFPEPQYRYIIPTWKESTTQVSLNTAGNEYRFMPAVITRVADDSLTMTYGNEICNVVETWSIDNAGDIRVSQTLTAKTDGYFSLSTPSLVSISGKDLDYAIIPGVLHGSVINSDFVRAYAYSFGIPDRPVVVRERSASTLASLITGKNGVTVAVAAEPRTGRNPWEYDRRTDKKWRLGLSLMNRSGELTPTLCHPVLGEEGSYLVRGNTTTFSFRYSLGKRNWFETYLHIVDDIYNFSETLKLRRNRMSLTSRLYMIYDYLVNDSTSKWRNCKFDGNVIGAQDYLGGVYQSEKDAMKNADYGAMWMLARVTSDPRLTEKRLPFALNFKLKQQNITDSFFMGAPRGQYYLYKGKRFTEEWGPYTEPIGTTYYMLMDLGNIWLFGHHDADIKQAIRRAADRLMAWMSSDGEWKVAYDNATRSPMFEDIHDYRPTFYGLLVAYRVLGDSKYLEAARRGAGWYVRNAVNTSSYLGVCGDTRFVSDFATIQSVQALLDLYEACGDETYKDAAIRAARFYTTSVYTHPVAGRQKKIVKGTEREDWEITQAGLSFEHGGVIGSANLHGPILLASHAGLFVRMARLTGDRIFLDMARSAAIGRDAFVDTKTGVASYYWVAMNQGAGPYPHHAWWQLGWITDYLLSEAEYRSNGGITFPAGFVTPKVGPHRAYGFAPGMIYGKEAALVMRHGLAVTDNPNVEAITAKGDGELYVILLNDTDCEQTVTVNVNPSCLFADMSETSFKVRLKPYGLHTLTVK